MFILGCCTKQTTSFSIRDAASWAQVLISIINLFFIVYIFKYRRDKDLKTKKENIELQWFKELIVQPNILKINGFYENLNTLKNRIQRNNLSDEERIDLINFVKENQSSLRKSFVDLLAIVNQDLYKSAIDNLDKLTDNITEAVFNDGLNLTHPPTYEKEIGSKISHSRKNLTSLIYNHKGV